MDRYHEIWKDNYVKDKIERPASCVFREEQILRTKLGGVHMLFGLESCFILSLSWEPEWW